MSHWEIPLQEFDKRNSWQCSNGQAIALKNSSVGIMIETVMEKLLPPNANKNMTRVIIYGCVKCCCGISSYDFLQRCLRNDDYSWAHIRCLWKVSTQD